MAKPLRTAIAGTFFLTTNTHQRRRIFHVERNAQLLHETLQRYRAEGLYKLHAFVIMPDHIHLLITTEDLPRAMNHIKGSFSRQLASKSPAWQHGYTDHLVETREEFESRRDYIHNNPVRAGLVERPEDYRFSSAHRG